MIHYCLQFQALIRKSADAVTAARLELFTAYAENEAAQKAAAKATARLERATASLAAERSRFEQMVTAGPGTTVDEYHATTGRYPNEDHTPLPALEPAAEAQHNGIF